MMAERKLEYFAEAIEREIEARRRRLLHQIANDLSKETAAEIKAAEERVSSRVKAARRHLMQKANKKIALATAEARAGYITKQNFLHAKILADVTKELISFTQSEKYEGYLIEKINMAKTAHTFSTVKLCPRGTQFSDAIQNKTGLMPVQGKDDFIGGFVLQGNRVKSDHTFKARLQGAGTA
jgi:vacuolar-type H+-ATPase subunit E/Vma4